MRVAGFRPTRHERILTSGLHVIPRRDAVKRSGSNLLPPPQVKQNLIGADDLISTLAQRRQVLLKHTADLLCGESLGVRQPEEREAKLSAILVSSLEELKVAEEELRERTEALADQRDEQEQRVRTIRQLFELAPACLLVTDCYGNILDVNRACQMLLKRNLASLERQPLARFIPADDRRGFREGLTRLVETEGVSDWRLQLIRPTDAPLAVTAAVQVARNVDSPSGIRLFWSLRVLEIADTPIS